MTGRRAALKAEVVAGLAPGETLVWAGHPDPGATLSKMRFLFWIGLPIMAAAGAVAYFHVAGQVGLLVGAALTAAPFVNAWRAANTIYALTDRRAIVRCRLMGSVDETSVDLGCADPEPEILRGKGNVGTVLFVSGLPPRRRHTDYLGKFGFWDVHNAEVVASIVARAVRG
jgi:hypothetical protein